MLLHFAIFMTQFITKENVFFMTCIFKLSKLSRKTPRKRKEKDCKTDISYLIQT